MQDSLLDRALGLHRAGRLAEAEAIYRQIIKTQPGHFRALHNLGLVHAQRGYNAEAVYQFELALKSNPDSAEAHDNRGSALKDLNRFDEALASYDRAIALKPDYAQAFQNRGDTLALANRLEEALESYQRAIALKPDHAEALINRGYALQQLERIEEALASYDTAIALMPGVAETYFNRGIALSKLNRIEEALASYDRAIALKPGYADALNNRALAKLLLGRFREAWADHEWRWQTNAFAGGRPNVSAPAWQGEDLASRRILVFCEQGFGDIIQFARYLPLLVQRGARVTFLMPETIVRLLRPLTSDIEVISQSGNAGAFDFQCALMSLPYRFNTDLASIPNQVPYLSAEEPLIGRWKERIGEHGFKVGIAWHGNPKKLNHSMFIPLQEFAPLAAIPGVRLISLQYRDGLDQLARLPADIRIETLGDDFNRGPDGFVDTAAVMSNLDLVITCDTSIAHLAGALARPTWIGLKQVPYWPWMLEREDSPWYPTVRLFRQPQAGAWAPVFARMGQELRSMVSTGPGGRASHIDPPPSSYAIMRRARPYRGESKGPGKDVHGELDPTPGITERSRPEAEVGRAAQQLGAMVIPGGATRSGTTGQTPLAALPQAGSPLPSNVPGAMPLIYGGSVDQVLFGQDVLRTRPGRQRASAQKSIDTPRYTLMKSQLCTCGSGLRSVRCCGATLEVLAAPAAARHLEPLIERARDAFARGALEEAERLALDILELAPGHFRALALLYELRKESRPQAAEVLLKRLVALDPDDVAATQELALLLIRKGDYDAAEVHARNSVRIAPQHPQSHNLLGMVLAASYREPLAEYHYRRALELADRRDPVVLANLATVVLAAGRVAEARSLYQESTTLGPQILDTCLGWARLEEADGDFTAAADLIARAEQLDPGNSRVALLRAAVLRRTGARDEALKVLLSIRQASDHQGLDHTELLEIGRLLDGMNRYDDAWPAFVEGKRMLRQTTGLAFQADIANDLSNRLQNFFRRALLNNLPRAGLMRDCAQPIFILGFVRSGTTLAEQILTAHPRIAPGNELLLIAEISQMLPRLFNSPLSYPEALAELWMVEQREGLDDLRDHYLRRVRQYGIMEPNAPWFTDKAPLNSTHLGLIALLFPQSPVIHLIRHPLDVVLSTFSHELLAGYYHAFDLESAARYFVMIADLIEHYRRQMDIRYLPIKYEDIVDDLEGSVRRMLEFIGEPFDPRCVNFHESRRYAHTPSYAQVKDKLYDRSRYRYRHYLRHLQPVIPILEPVINRLGYTIEPE
jgi:tetratricopeptide (TPR) repeat protein